MTSSNLAFADETKLEHLAALEPLEVRVAMHPFLCGMNRHHIKLLADCAMAKTFKNGDFLFREGEFANRFYLIETGNVSVEATDRSGRSVTIELVGAGSLVGWSWLFPPYVWHFNARATEQTEALFFYGTILREYCEKDPTLGFELFKRMSAVMVKRLQAARDKLLNAYRETAAVL
jgi:CRP/FNR family cyclic AMP-dependent transcriptional regulator